MKEVASDGDWPGDIAVQDTVVVPLPNDLPVGDYQVYTGLYDAATFDRMPVVDENNSLQPDGVIRLGTFSVTE